MNRHEKIRLLRESQTRLDAAQAAVHYARCVVKEVGDLPDIISFYLNDATESISDAYLSIEEELTDLSEVDS